MASQNRERYYENLCNRLHDLANHYSTVRVIGLSFLIPLGALLFAQDQQWAGVWVIIVGAIIGNFYFGMRSLEAWLRHRNIQLWLEIGDITKDYENEYKEDIAYLGVLLRQLRPKNTDKDWQKRWTEVLQDATTTERWIQLIILGGSFVLILFLYLV